MLLSPKREGETMNRYRSPKHAMTRLRVMLIAFTVASSSATASAGKVQGIGQAEGVKTLIVVALQKASAANEEARAAVDEARAIVEKQQSLREQAKELEDAVRQKIQD